MEFIIAILSILLVYVSYRLYKIIKSIEDMEDYIIELEETIIQVSDQINESYQRLKSVDRIGSFEADDEVGYIFKDIKKIVEDLNKIITKK